MIRGKVAQLKRLMVGMFHAGRENGHLSAFEHAERIRTFRDKHKGQRCFIIGNGPSLNKADLTLIRDEITFGVNGIFYKTDELGFRPTYYMAEDNHVVNDNIKRINLYECTYKFFPNKYKSVIKPADNVVFLPADWGFYREYHPYFCKPRFSKSVADIIYVGQSVTYLNMQLAYYMGFEKVYLIGMDFSYALPKSTIVEGVNYTSRDDDPNHFHPDYFGKGKKWHDPKLDRVAICYEYAKKVYEENGRKIYNATIEGRLEIFSRVDYYSLFED